MEQVPTYRAIKDAINRADAMGFNVKVNTHEIRLIDSLGIESGPFYTANEINSYLNGYRDGTEAGRVPF